MQFQYNAPTAPTIERPRCWGRSFDEMSSECRKCGFQNSCKDEIIRLNINRPAPPMAMQPMYGPAPAVPYAAPQQVPPMMAFQPQPPPRPQQPQQYAQEAVQRTVPMAMTQQPPYGWLHDPLYYTMAATPPPVRPQMQGESFVERVAKNAGLAMVEALFGQCFLAVRQLILPPTPKSVEQKVVDVPTVPGGPQLPPK